MWKARTIHLQLDVLVAITIVGSHGSQEDDLRDDNGEDDTEGSEGDSDDLDAEHDNTAPSRLGEAGPGVANSSIAEATDNNGLDTAVERAVERNDGVGVGGEKRGLDSNENNVGGNLNSDLEKDSDEQDAENAAETLELRNLSGLVAAKQVENTEGAKVDDLRGSPEDESRSPGGGESGLERRETAPELERRRRRDDDVNPGGAELNADERTDQVGQNKGIRNDGISNAVDECRDDSLGEEAGQTTEDGAETTSRSE